MDTNQDRNDPIGSLTEEVDEVDKFTRVDW